MNPRSSSSSNISIDSLEIKSTQKYRKNETNIEDKNIETILVPFYENDVLIKISKCPIKNYISKKHKGIKEKINKNIDKEESNSYLVNKNCHKTKRSYLEKFRKQFNTNLLGNIQKTEEIRSLSPEFGDTERESFSDDGNSPDKDFFNTEAYNDIYYEKLINQEITQYLDKNFEQTLQFSEEIKSKTNDENIIDNLKSISQVSLPRRHIKRISIEHVQNIRLGGLGPDIENIKPRLERAKSLQRYSEKVRLENRKKIYKKSLQDENDKKIARETSAKEKIIWSKNKLNQKSTESSYLLNKSSTWKKCASKSAEIKNYNKNNKYPLKINKPEAKLDSSQNLQENTMTDKKTGPDIKDKNTLKDNIRPRLKSSRKPDAKPDMISTVEPPVQINFMVNIGTLKTLEEKHRMYQEKVKEFTLDTEYRY